MTEGDLHAMAARIAHLEAEVEKISEPRRAMLAKAWDEGHHGSAKTNPYRSHF